MALPAVPSSDGQCSPAIALQPSSDKFNAVAKMTDVRRARGHVWPHKEWETNGTNECISKTEIRVTDVKRKLMMTSGEKDTLEAWD